MSGRPSAATEHAIELIRQGHSAYRAAKIAGIALSTIYRSRLYRKYRDAHDQPEKNRR